jgi:phage gpG-like protein
MTNTLLIELEDDAIVAALDRAIAALENTAPLMEDIGARLEANAQLRFETKTDPTGAPWAKLETESELARYWIERKYPDGFIPGTLLERTGFLRASLAHNSGEDFVEIGTSREVPGVSQPTWQVGMLHEFGTRIMPRRGILTKDPKTGELGADDQADVLAILNDVLGGAFA